MARLIEGPWTERGKGAEIEKVTVDKRLPTKVKMLLYGFVCNFYLMFNVANLFVFSAAWQY